MGSLIDLSTLGAATEAAPELLFADVLRNASYLPVCEPLPVKADVNALDISKRNFHTVGTTFSVDGSKYGAISSYNLSERRVNINYQHVVPLPSGTGHVHLLACRSVNTTPAAALLVIPTLQEVMTYEIFRTMQNGLVSNLGTGSIDLSTVYPSWVTGTVAVSSVQSRDTVGIDGAGISQDVFCKMFTVTFADSGQAGIAYGWIHVLVKFVYNGSTWSTALVRTYEAREIFGVGVDMGSPSQGGPIFALGSTGDHLVYAFTEWQTQTTNQARLTTVNATNMTVSQNLQVADNTLGADYWLNMNTAKGTTYLAEYVAICTVSWKSTLADDRPWFACYQWNGTNLVPVIAATRPTGGDYTGCDYQMTLTDVSPYLDAPRFQAVSFTLVPGVTSGDGNPTHIQTVYEIDPIGLSVRGYLPYGYLTMPTTMGSWAVPTAEREDVGRDNLLCAYDANLEGFVFNRRSGVLLATRPQPLSVSALKPPPPSATRPPSGSVFSETGEWYDAALRQAYPAVGTPKLFLVSPAYPAVTQLDITLSATGGNLYFVCVDVTARTTLVLNLSGTGTIQFVNSAGVTNFIAVNPQAGVMTVSCFNGSFTLDEPNKITVSPTQPATAADGDIWFVTP